MELALRKDRITAGAAAVLIEGAILYVLLIGLLVRPGAVERSEALQLIEVKLTPLQESKPVPPPPPPKVAQPRAKKPEGGAAPPNIHSRATPVTVPEPIVVLPPVQPIVSSPVPAQGSDRTSGNADVPGPGTGSGGFGTGTGSGRGGYGSGGGGGGGRPTTPPRKIQGRLGNSDYPRWAWEAGVGGRVGVIFSIETDGRVGSCDIEESSGSGQLDDMTCGLIRQRYRFRPALDREGRPVRVRMTENHEWVMQIMPRER